MCLAPSEPTSGFAALLRADSPSPPGEPIAFSVHRPPFGFFVATGKHA